MIEPFFNEEYKWYDIEFYNILEVAEKGEQVKVKRFTNDDLPPLREIATKAREMGYDTFTIKEKVEIHKEYDVDSYFD